MRYVGDVLIKASLCESWVGPFWYMGLFFKHHPSCMSCTSHFRRAALRVAPYAGPGRGVFYELRVARSDVVSLSRSRRYAASESAKKAVARSSWFVARKSSPSFRTGAPRGRPYKTWNIMSNCRGLHVASPLWLCEHNAC